LLCFPFAWAICPPFPATVPRIRSVFVETRKRQPTRPAAPGTLWQIRLSPRTCQLSSPLNPAREAYRLSLLNKFFCLHIQLRFAGPSEHPPAIAFSELL
jgi:hypothetical protein